MYYRGAMQAYYYIMQTDELGRMNPRLLTEDELEILKNLFQEYNADSTLEDGLESAVKRYSEMLDLICRKFMERTEEELHFIWLSPEEKDLLKRIKEELKEYD